MSPHLTKRQRHTVALLTHSVLADPEVFVPDIGDPEQGINVQKSRQTAGFFVFIDLETCFEFALDYVRY
jgi:hypothetical protein